jgi:hypothetical protein
MNKKMNFRENFRNFSSPTRTICNHLIGKEHNLGHRIVVGIAIMIIGVYMTKLAADTHILWIDIVGDTIGFLLHGIGAIPFVELFIKLNHKQDGTKPKN